MNRAVLSTAFLIEWVANKAISLSTSRAAMSRVLDALTPVACTVSIYNSLKESAMESGRCFRNKSFGAGSYTEIRDNTTDSVGASFCSGSYLAGS